MTFVPRTMKVFGKGQAKRKSNLIAKALKKGFAGVKGKVKAPAFTEKEKEERKKTMEKLAAIDNDRKVWVGGLPKDCTWKMVEQHFSKVASKPKITEIFSAKKGTACLVFADEETAASAIAAGNGTTLKGKPLEVDVWTKVEKEARSK